MNRATYSELPALLLTADLAVKEDPAQPGFVGTVCLGVRGEERTCWWHASFGATAESSFVAAPPAGTDCVLVVGESDAKAMIATGKFPNEPSFIAAEGDLSLLQRFVDRYLTKRTQVSIRGAK